MTSAARAFILGAATAILAASLWALLPVTTAEIARVVLAFDAAVALVVALAAMTREPRGPDGVCSGGAAALPARRVEMGVRVVDPRVANVLSVRRAARVRHAELVA